MLYLPISILVFLAIILTCSHVVTRYEKVNFDHNNNTNNSDSAGTQRAFGAHWSRGIRLAEIDTDQVDVSVEADVGNYLNKAGYPLKVIGISDYHRLIWGNIHY